MYGLRHYTRDPSTGAIEPFPEQLVAKVGGHVCVCVCVCARVYEVGEGRYGSMEGPP